MHEENVRIGISQYLCAVKLLRNQIPGNRESARMNLDAPLTRMSDTIQVDCSPEAHPHSDATFS